MAWYFLTVTSTMSSHFCSSLSYSFTKRYSSCLQAYSLRELSSKSQFHYIAYWKRLCGALGNTFWKKKAKLMVHFKSMLYFHATFNRQWKGENEKHLFIKCQLVMKYYVKVNYILYFLNQIWLFWFLLTNKNMFTNFVTMKQNVI